MQITEQIIQRIARQVFNQMFPSSLRQSGAIISGSGGSVQYAAEAGHAATSDSANNASYAQNSGALDNHQASYFATAADVTTLQGYFTNGVANEAAKLSTVSKTAWGRTYWSSGGVPTDVAGNIYMIDPDATNQNRSSSKIKFSSVGGSHIDDGRSPYIQAVDMSSSYGRKRLSVFQSNAANYTDEFVEAFTILPNGNVGIGTSSPAYKLHVNGDACITGALKIGDIYIGQDANGNLEVYKLNGTTHVAANLYATGGISALGQGSSGGGGGAGDVTWTALHSVNTLAERTIDLSFISSALTSGGYATQNWVQNQNYFTAADAYTKTESDALYVPLGLVNIQSRATSEAHYSLNNLTDVGCYGIVNNANAAYFDDRPVTSNTAFRVDVSYTRKSSDYIKQRYQQSGSRYIYERYSSNSGTSWGDWKQVQNDLSLYLLSSDISAWAKASTKPSYAFSEITGTATASQVPNIEDLTNFSTKVYDASTSRTKNTVLAAPNGSAGAATFRALVAADIPNLAASKITSGTLDAARIPNLSWNKITDDVPTTLSGYGITDAKIASGVITLGNKTITPVTSVAMTVPTGFSVGGSPITKTGTLAVSYDDGYEGFTTALKNMIEALYSWFEVDNDGNIKTKDYTENNTTKHRGFYSPSFISALGKGASGGGGGAGDVTWTALHSTNTLAERNIDLTFLSTALTAGGYATQNWVQGQGYFTSADAYTKTESDALYVPLGLVNIQSRATSEAHYSLNNLTDVGCYGIVNNANAAYFDDRPVTGSTAFRVDVSYTRKSSDYIKQRYQQSGSKNIYERYSTNGGTSWGDWTLVNTDEKVKVTETNPTSSTTYYPIFVTGSGTLEANANDGLRYATLEGTASALGVGRLTIGNSTASGTAGNKTGVLRIYTNKSYYGQFSGNTDDLTSNRTYTLPNASGTLVLDTASQALTNKTYNGYTLGAACAKGVTDNTSATAVTSSDTNLITGRTLYYAGYTKNIGTVTQVKVGTTAYDPSSSGVVSLPAYPTSLPASDVYSWAKATTKPSYNLDEVADGTTRKLANYLPLAGGKTMTDHFSLVGEQYDYTTNANSYGLDCNNSDVIGVNGIFTNDLSGDWTEGINFKRTNGNWDSLRAADGHWIMEFNNATPTNADVGLRVVGSTYSMEFMVGSSNVNRGIYSNTSSSWLLYFNASNTILNYGNVGIGTTSPQTKLHVAGTIYATGGVTCLTQASASDITMKDVIAENVLPTIEQIANAPAIRFKWKEKPELGEQVGTIAQYWHKVMPEAVKETPDGKLSLEYGVIATLNSIRIAKKVMSHEDRIKALERENERLRKEIEQLKSA